MNDKILVTGARGGIGRFIHEQFGCVGLTRQSSDREELRKRSFDVIVHCAWNHTPTRLITSENLGEYYHDNVALTEEMVKIPHEYFVFFSSVDVYQGGDQPHSEDETVQADSIRSIYATMKLISESVVQKGAKNFLILRPTFLMGPYMRLNNLSRLFNDPHPVLTLDASSLYNVIHYADVLEFIRLAIARRETGIINLASVGSVSLFRIAEVAGKKVVFGGNHYETGNISNKKAVLISPAFKKTSEEVLWEFLSGS